MSMCVRVHTCRGMCVETRRQCRSRFSPSTTWVPGIELGLSILATVLLLADPFHHPYYFLITLKITITRTHYTWNTTLVCVPGD